jgi:hypothetical protein
MSAGAEATARACWSTKRLTSSVAVHYESCTLCEFEQERSPQPHGIGQKVFLPVHALLNKQRARDQACTEGPPPCFSRCGLRDPKQNGLAPRRRIGLNKIVVLTPLVHPHPASPYSCDEPDVPPHYTLAVHAMGEPHVSEMAIPRAYSRPASLSEYANSQDGTALHVG